MNAERLHALARAIHDELDNLRVPQLLSELVAALNNVVQQPQQAEHQQRVSERRAELREALTSAPSNEFSPAWRQHLRELEVNPLLGLELLERIEEIFSRNEITPASAAEELTPLSDQEGELLEAVQHTTDGLSTLGVGYEELEPGGFELGILIPRGEVDNELGELGKEFVKVENILLPFIELATGSRPGIEVRSISSSDFGTYLAALPVVAACIAHAVQKVIDIYKGILEIRTLRQGLLEEDIPDEALEPVKQFVEARMEQGLDEIAAELRAEFGDHLSEERANELMTEIRGSLRAIANRIDRGYNVEVRHEPLPPDTEEADEEEGDRTSAEPDYGTMVRERLPTMQFINLTGKTILSLPEGEGPDLEDGDPSGEGGGQ